MSLMALNGHDDARLSRQLMGAKRTSARGPNSRSYRAVRRLIKLAALRRVTERNAAAIRVHPVTRKAPEGMFDSIFRTR